MKDYLNKRRHYEGRTDIKRREGGAEGKFLCYDCHGISICYNNKVPPVGGEGDEGRGTAVVSLKV